MRLEADLTGLSENQRQMIPLLKDAAAPMDEVFWMQAYGDKLTLLARDQGRRRATVCPASTTDPGTGWRTTIHFFDGVGPKPTGANFYPPDMTEAEFETAVAASR